MRPAIKPGLLVVWRDRDTLQIGIDPRRAVALSGMGRAAALIGLLDGSREHSQVLAAAERLGIPRDAADQVIGLLAAAGAVQDFPAAELRALPDGPRARLARELATVSLAHGHTDGGARVLARRQAASVRVYGAGPLGAEIASLLTASGVSRVVCTGPVGQTPARPAVPGRPRARRRGSPAAPATP
ncbi:MAG TPA: thiamine biosynthesis protein ThiF, partial [Streptosporangiaceae bacterium]